MKKKNVLREFIKVLEAGEERKSGTRKWLVPLPAKKLLPRKNPNYTPLHEGQLEQSVLISHFQRWSGNRHPKKKHKMSKSIMTGLDCNLFANILATSIRSEKITDALLPEALLIRLGLVHSSEGKGIISPLLHFENHIGKCAYVYCNHSAFDMLSDRFWKKVESLIKPSANGIISNPGGVSKYTWNNKDNLEIYKYVLLEDLKKIAERLKKGTSCNSQVVSKTFPRYVLNWRAENDVDENNQSNACIEISEKGDKIIFNMPLILGMNSSHDLESILTTVSTPYTSTSSSSTIILPCSSNEMLFLRHLWKFYLFSKSNYIYSAYDSLRLKA